ncbi:MAG: glycosyltransferase [Opitutales bacterium]|nr:glycosyltransferase [Opitutales bacterium]MCH8541483.1 glycosyltransferase [Opitutales bacterium]
MKLALFLSRWGNGGAERQFSLLAKGLAGRGHEVVVLSVLPGGLHWDALENSEGVSRHALYPSSTNTQVTLPTLLGGIRRLRRFLHKEKFEILYSALVTGNFMAAWANPPSSPTKLVWGIRNSVVEGSWQKHFLYFLSNPLRQRPDMVICNSRAGQTFAKDRGLWSAPSKIVPNGIDTERFQPDLRQRQALRKELKIAETDFVIAAIARLTPMKDHPTLLRAVAMARKSYPQIRLVCAGEGSAPYKKTLQKISHALDLQNAVLWIPPTPEPQKLHQMADLFCSTSSRGEGLSNSLAEAMACDIPVIATRTGDHRTLVEGAGKLVPPSDPIALAEAIKCSLQQHNSDNCPHGRERILSGYSLEKMISRTEEYLQEVWQASETVPR